MSDSDEEELDKETLGRQVNISIISMLLHLIFILNFFRLQKNFPLKSYKNIKIYFHFLIEMEGGLLEQKNLTRFIGRWFAVKTS